MLTRPVIFGNMIAMLRPLVALAFLTVAVVLPAQDWASLTSELGPGVAKVELRNDGVVESSGSGFLITSEGRLLTSAHVVSPAQFDKKIDIQLTFPQSSTPQKTFSAQIELISDELDLAILKVSGTGLQPLVLSDVTQPRLMSEILVLGFPLGLNFKATPGYIQAFQDVPQLGSMLDLSAAVDPGNSGGPVVGKDGKVVGIVTSKLPGYNFNLALPIRNAIDFLSMVDHPAVFQVVTTPEGARVFINGRFKGTSPLSVSLMAQNSEVSVEQEGFETMKRTVQLVAGKNPDQEFVLSASASTTAKVQIEVNPVGAQVWINNSALGKAPIAWTADKGARLRIRIEAPGYTTLNTVVTLTNENQQTIHLDLKKGWF